MSPFASPDLAFGFYLLLSLIFGYLIGAERESRGKSAGIATQCLVIGGSMAFSFFSALVEPSAPTRLAANVVTGIGFLGAGIIFHHAMQKDEDKVINLTTAATIWMSAAVGMALGFGQLAPALALVIFAMVALRIPHVVPGRK